MLITLSKRALIFISFLLVLLLNIFIFFNPTKEAISWTMATETIIIDAGHGGTFPGKISADGIEEKHINLTIAQKLQGYLAQSGCDIIMTRTTDTHLYTSQATDLSLLALQREDLQQRVAISTAANADYFLSIHCNSIPAEQWHGAQVFYRPDDPASKALAEDIQAQLIKILGNTDRKALPRTDTYLFEHLTMPAVIIECGFLSNLEETELLQDDLYQQKIAHAIYLGLSDYLAHY